MKWIKRNYGQCPYQIEINQLILMQSVRKDKMKPFDHHKILSESIKSSACNFTKINTPPWVFFTFFKLYKCYQIAQRITYFHCSSWVIVSGRVSKGSILGSSFSILDICV